jgi:hypothetical protein
MSAIPATSGVEVPSSESPLAESIGPLEVSVDVESAPSLPVMPPAPPHDARAVRMVPTKTVAMVRGDT